MFNGVIVSLLVIKVSNKLQIINKKLCRISKKLDFVNKKLSVINRKLFFITNKLHTLHITQNLSLNLPLVLGRLAETAQFY